MIDPVTEECRRVREQIVERSGGFEGYFDQLEELDRKRLAAKVAKQKSAKKSAVAVKQQGRKRLA